MTNTNPYFGLENYTYEFFTGKAKQSLDCWLECEEADPEVGLGPSITLVYAEVNGIDISELLSDHVRTEIEQQAQLTFESFEEDDYDYE
jgi:hypothetical protein